jgi:putative heme degradation protein
VIGAVSGWYGQCVVWLIAAVSSWFNAVDESFSFSLRTLKIASSVSAKPDGASVP